MSTRIDTGFKFVLDDVSGVTKVVLSLTPAIEQLQRDRYVKEFARLLVQLLDETQVALSQGDQNVVTEHVPTLLVRRVIKHRQGKVRATFERDPAVDLEVQLRCWYSPTLKYFLGYVASEFSSSVLSVMKNAGAIVDYAFWDNTDPDATVPKHEWAQRAKEWNNVLAGKAGAGFQFVFPGDVSAFMPTWAELERALPSIEFRAEELAVPAVYARWSRCNPLQGEITPMAALAHRAAFRTLLGEDRNLQAELAVEMEATKVILLTGKALEESMRRQQPLRVSSRFEIPTS